jgi:hypothetical protein
MKYTYAAESSRRRNWPPNSECAVRLWACTGAPKRRRLRRAEAVVALLRSKSIILTAKFIMVGLVGKLLSYTLFCDAMLLKIEFVRLPMMLA